MRPNTCRDGRVRSTLTRSAVSSARKHNALLDNDFRRFADNRRILYLRRDLTTQAAAILAAVGGLGGLAAQASPLNGAGNRHSGFSVKIDQQLELFVRYARRGGLIRFLVSDLYCGANARPVRELAVAAEARRRGIPVAEPIGATVEWLAPMLYRGAFLTRALAGMTMWQFVQTDDDPLVRMHVAGQVRQAINLAHQKGLFHADLNLHNVFITTVGERFTVALLDLDKARILGGPLAPALRASNLARLRRSIRKLDPKGRYFDASIIATLTGDSGHVAWSSMKRRIVSFHRDEQGDWVADLECGHRQHVRHRPPFELRPWVITEEGRQSRIDCELGCKLCDG